ncbi:hypothetical protein BGHDH14_bgh00952 [Blumeria hordei DH14]|uniref:Uncharacterized protein n=1 Tax=Blumeria graminis f. sp. hordei (strain DH14) TaxID=546991 RepID=N1JEV7_BLUG1|nr:hypothetical protein BGHDH14_bgh00952 [Blumeria hordei DH14]
MHNYNSFALCPKDGDSENVMEKIKSVCFFRDAPVKKAIPWTSYHIKNYCLKPVIAEALKDALATAAGLVPVAIAASRENDANPMSSSTTWIVRFPESHQSLPHNLFLFGCHTQTRILPKRQMAVQCTWCWLWHNTRTCASDPRCSLCRSSRHSKKDHANQCGATGQNICPNRCIHCHGRHPADNVSSDLRPNPSGPPMSQGRFTKCVAKYYI